MRPISRAVVRLAALGLSILIALAAAEAALRFSGTPTPVPDMSVQAWAAYDPEEVWINRPGAQVSWPPWGMATFDADGARITRPPTAPAPSDNVVLVLGCSFTQGSGVDDRDTFAWRLQERFPDFNVRNFGTGGYGTYQSLIRFRRFLRENRTVPRLVIFGFADFHGYRDRGTRAWLQTRGNARAVIPPRVDLRDGRLVEFPGKLVPLSALARRSVLWNRVETTYRERTEYMQDDEEKTVAVQRAVLLRMQEEVARAGSRLLVADLWTSPPNRAPWKKFFEDHRFDVAECVTDRTPFAHPDPFWHLLHADCLEDAVRRDGLLDE